MDKNITNKEKKNLQIPTKAYTCVHYSVLLNLKKDTYSPPLHA